MQRECHVSKSPARAAPAVPSTPRRLPRPTRQHPRQHNLDLRDAQDQRGGVRPAAQQATGTYDATAHIVNALTNTDADGVITFKDVK